MSSEKPLLVVLGATGTQGGSVISHFLSLSPSPYALRGVTRDPTSTKATALTARGVEMVTATFDDSASLNTAFKGASAIFSVTDFWPPFFDPSQREKAAESGQSIGERCRDLEVQQSRNIIDAAAKVDTLQRFVYSGLANSNKLSDGKYRYNYHFESKAIGEEHGRKAHPELWKKTTVFYAGFYLENWFGPNGALLRPKLNKEKDTVVLALNEGLGTALFPCYSAAENTGALVHAVLASDPGKKVIGVNEWLNFQDVARIIAQTLRKDIEFITTEDSFPIDDPDLEREMRDMMGFCVELGYDGHKVDKSVLQPGDLGVEFELRSVKEWIAKQDWALGEI